MRTPASLPSAAVRGRLPLALLAAVFLGPLALSFWLYYGGARFRPPGRVNYGELVAPPRSLPEVRPTTLAGQPIAPGFLRGTWSLVYVAAGACDGRCRQALADTRAVRLALERDGTRVQRVLAAFPDYGAPVAAAGRTYLVDPLGNLLMSYPPGADRAGILKDLKQLLRLSHVG
jgi:cytochrome oxidase Cu insertion factor (SCO1/SenC/PrrC family)